MNDVQRPVMIVEDDAKIADMMANYLRLHGYASLIQSNGAAALADIRRDPPGLVLLDLMLPGMDGIEVCRAVRAFSAVPIIMVTARVDEIDRLLGLEVGADDYVCKPFSPREVVARVKALLRRSQAKFDTIEAPAASAYRVDEAAQRIFVNQQVLNLTTVEFRLLRMLLSRPGHVFSRARLLDTVHDEFRDVSDRAIDSHVKNLRRKIDKLREGGSGIVSVYGAGYRYDPYADGG